MDRRRRVQERRRKENSSYEDTPKSSPSTPLAEHAPVTPQQRSTVRAVTPDEQGVDPLDSMDIKAALDSLAAPPLVSPRPLDKQASNKSIFRRRTSTESSTQPAVGTPTVTEYGSGHSRRKTIALHGPMDDSPLGSTSSLLSRSRNSSAQLTEAINSTDARSPTSNGFNKLPSSVSQPALGLHNGLASSISFGTTTTATGMLPLPSSRRILYLMKTLAGRMSGNVAFRRGVDGPWTNAYCFIREGEGSLICEDDFGQGAYTTLIPDLRGSRVDRDVEGTTPYIEVFVPKSTLEVHLRPATQTDLDSWYAALLCWQPMQPAKKDRPKSQAARLSAHPATRPEARDGPEAAPTKEAPVIKVGQMVYWDLDATYKNPLVSSAQGRSNTPRPTNARGHKTFGFRWWKRVSSTLRENGEFRLFTEAEDNQLITTIRLSQLSRSAIQRLDPSVLDQEYSIAIYTQYTNGPPDQDRQPSIFLSFDTSDVFEVWFVLLRAFTIQQLYGPKPSGDPDDETQVQQDVFRLERGLSLCVLEARLNQVEKLKSTPDHYAQSKRTNSPKTQGQVGYYVEIHLDGESRGKTSVKNSEKNPFWSQEFDYLDLPAVLSSASVHLKQRTGDGLLTLKGGQDAKALSEAYGMVQDPKDPTAMSGYTGTLHDITIGKVEIVLDQIDTQKKSERLWTITNALEQEIGTMLIRARAEEVVILMRHEYEPLHRLLHAFENGVTVQIFNAISSELKRLSDAFVNIFQVSGRSTEWLMALIEDEVDGHGKDTPLTKPRYSQRLGNAEPDPLLGSPSNDREMAVRDMNKNATLEANLLFRGNTLLTKALDTHMRRVGAEYLQAALGGVIARINENDPDCEVDPNRCTDKHELQKNWSRLLSITEDVWDSIQASVRKCPVDLRYIFRHIKSCAEDKYGDFLRSVRYSSVSGFLFLRFFCPAVLSPKLFGLLKEDPKPRAKRTFVLIAKSLQTLANMATFGSKEAWMEPMNAFLTSNRDAFKRFIEDMCSVPPGPASSRPRTLPSYSTPNAIKSRLSPVSKEGFPSLPFLLDEGREYANLVEIWMQAAPSTASPPRASLAPLAAFDQLCRALHLRTQTCLARAERAQDPPPTAPARVRTPDPPPRPREDEFPRSMSLAAPFAASPAPTAVSLDEPEVLPRKTRRTPGGGASRRTSAAGDEGGARQGFLELVGWGGKKKR